MTIVIIELYVCEADNNHTVVYQCEKNAYIRKNIAHIIDNR